MPAITFRSRFTMVLCIIAWAGLAVVLAVVVATPGVVERGLIPLGLVAVAAIIWAVLWSPFVRVSDDAVTIANVLREIEIPWAALIHVDTKFSLTLTTPGRTYSATAAPAPGQLSGLNASRSQRTRTGGAGTSVRPGDLPSTDSGQAAELVRERWKRLRDSGAIEAGIADSVPVSIRPRIVQIATITAATVVLIVGVLVF